MIARHFSSLAALASLIAASPIWQATINAAEIEGLPQPAELRASKFAIPAERTLTNGLRVIVVERSGLPLLSAALVIKSGAEDDPQKVAGLADFTASLLTQGTTSRTATQIASEVEALGATLKTRASWDATTISLTTLSDNADPAFDLLADVARHPKFAADEIERLRRQTLDDLRLSFEEPRTLAHLATARAILGNAPYAHSENGTLASIAKVNRQQLANFHDSHFTPDHALLVIAGNVTSDAAFALAQKAFGDWKAAKYRRPENAEAAAPPKPRTILVDMPNAGQSAVFVGAMGIVRGSSDYFSGQVANAILGGGYTSRLNEEIRIKRGLSYGAGSTLAAFRENGIFTARAQTKNASAAEVAKAMLIELARLGSEDVPADYLAARRAVLIGKFAREFETNDGYVAQLADLALYDLPLDLINQYAARIEAVTAADVRAFATKHLAPASMSIVVAGAGKGCAKPLREAFPQLEVIPKSTLDLDLPGLRKTADTR